MAGTVQSEFAHSARKHRIAITTLAFAAAYLAVITLRFVAAHYSDSLDRSFLVRAARLDPGNAAYAHNAGRFELLAGSNPQTALPWLDKAAQLNPYKADYWVDLALAQQAVGNTTAERDDLRQALEVAPRTPEIAWQAANLFLGQGSPDDAMRAFRLVIENDPPLTALAIQTCWKIHPNAQFLLDNVVTPNADESFLGFLAEGNEQTAAAIVWQKMYSLQQPISRAHLFEYIRYLIAQQQPEEASKVWRQAAGMADLSAYQPSSENLLVNGDFSMEILDGGFDWMHLKTRGVALALDPSENHSSPRSLRIVFDGPGIEDAGIRQMVAVDPNTSYEFSGFYKASEMDGAGGTKFALQDLYRETTFYMSDELQNADFWKQVSGGFVTGPETHMLVLRIARVPAGSPIRGKLWVDGLRLVATDPHREDSGRNPQ